MKLSFDADKNLSVGIVLIKDELNFTITDEASADIAVTVKELDEEKLAVSLDGKKARIAYGKGKARFFRGLSILLSWIGKGINKAEKTEHPIFKTNGAMLDTSRNAVMNLKYIKLYLCKMALMGMNTFMLYTEDTYRIEGRPYFGHLRGRYSKDELKEIDAYAAALGIEVIPCIQVLGHLATALRWPAMGKVRDTANALLVGAEETYSLIDDMLKTMRECFKSRRIHMGMDETHDLGTGAYLDKFGYRERKDIYFEHLARVSEMAKGYGFRPMIWSDMFFRMSAKGMEGFIDYDMRTVLPDDIGSYLPEGVQPVFWDYYQPNEEFYAVNIEKHKKISDSTIFAGGVWCWSGHSPLYSRSLRNTIPALDACKKGGIDEVIATVWHNGSSSSLIMSLAGLAWYAEYDYSGGKFCLDRAKETFANACKDSYDNIVNVEAVEYPHGGIVGLGSMLFNNDPLLGICDRHIGGIDTESYYNRVTEALSGVAVSAPLAPAYEVVRLLSSLLENKANFGIRLKEAYDKRDRAALSALADECDIIIEKLKKMRLAHRRAWMEYNKPFGFEVHDIRYGGMVMRFDTVKERIRALLAGEIEQIEELEEERLRYDGEADDAPLGVGFVWPRYTLYSTAGIL
ncbi:MAG: family 20 glycosylhydrolase [Clostridia bacterium]|nr:family 20 glycosylhydrolase [Clostridia bacterium]